MKTKVEILNPGIENQKALNFFDRIFFWDCKADLIMLEGDYDLVIERVLGESLNYDKDFPVLKKIYPLELIKEIALPNTQIFGNERIEAIANFFGFNKEDFYRWIFTDENGNIDLVRMNLV